METAAVRLLAGREHSREELYGKLMARGYAEEEIAPVLGSLANAGLQSDLRFAESFIASRARRGRGPLRIRAELRDRGVSDDLIAQLLDAYADVWGDELRRVHDTKYGSEPLADRKELAKRARFLESRGFPAEMIRRLLFK